MEAGHPVDPEAWAVMELETLVDSVKDQVLRAWVRKRLNGLYLMARPEPASG